MSGVRTRDDKTYGEYIGPVDLYLDDVEKIHAVLAESGLPVQIETPDHIFDSIEELSQEGARLTRVKLTTKKPYVSVQLDSPWHVWLFRIGNEPEAVGFYHNVREVLLRSRRRSAVVFGNVLVSGLVPILPLAVAGGLIGRAFTIDEPMPYVWAALLLLALTVVLQLAKTAAVAESALYTRRRGDVSSRMQGSEPSSPHTSSARP